jgi:1-deoxy-D-xylulose-5-phosphate reductoisomerase
LAYQCLGAGQAACLTFNAANEIAVQAFLDGKIGFLDIVRTVSVILDRIQKVDLSGLADILSLDQSVRRSTADYIQSNSYQHVTSKVRV